VSDIARPGLRHVFLRDMVLNGQIGVHAHEHGRHQRLRINVDLAVEESPGGTIPAGPARDELALVTDYARLARIVRDTVAAGHVKLVETLAERIASAALFETRIRSVRVRVEKLDVFDDVAAVGVEIERHAGVLSTRRD
jgi:dihydroneopterin aldolase